MRGEILNSFLNKRVKVVLKGSLFYEGLLLNIEIDCITIRDKYGFLVQIQPDEIISIYEVRKWK